MSLKLKLIDLAFSYQRSVTFGAKAVEYHVYREIITNMRAQRTNSGGTFTDHCYLLADFEAEGLESDAVVNINVKITAGDWVEEFSEPVLFRRTGAKEERFGITRTLPGLLSTKPFDSAKFEFSVDGQHIATQDVKVQTRD